MFATFVEKRVAKDQVYKVKQNQLANIILDSIILLKETKDLFINLNYYSGSGKRIEKVTLYDCL